MIGVRRARVGDAPAIAAVHVAAWRSTYPSILPADFLANLSLDRQAGGYAATIRAGQGVFVALASGADLAEPGGSRIVGFTTGGRAAQAGYGDGEIETLYVLDDFRERGIGRRLLRVLGEALYGAGCASAFVRVLRDNPSRYFYAHLGGVLAAEERIHFAGAEIVQCAYRWDPLARLLDATARA